MLNAADDKAEFPLKWVMLLLLLLRVLRRRCRARSSVFVVVTARFFVLRHFSVPRFRCVASRAEAGMAQQGATLQNYNNELVKCIEDLREKREEVRQMEKYSEKQFFFLIDILRWFPARLRRAFRPRLREFVSSMVWIFSSTWDCTKAAIIRERSISKKILLAWHVAFVVCWP